MVLILYINNLIAIFIKIKKELIWLGNGISIAAQQHHAVQKEYSILMISATIT